MWSRAESGQYGRYEWRVNYINPKMESTANRMFNGKQAHVHSIPPPSSGISSATSTNNPDCHTLPCTGDRTAGAYQANGQIKEAVKLLEHIVAIHTEVLAEDHPDRLLSERTLAAFYKDLVKRSRTRQAVCNSASNVRKQYHFHCAVRSITSRTGSEAKLQVERKTFREATKGLFKEG
ncbi:unnamed protein product [Aspergillus oryzae]|nr:unnamed protein product [Aspergillus oryzae]